MLSENLKTKRKAKGCTQDDVASFLNVKRQTYSAYERGVSLPDSETLTKLATFFETTTDFLVSRTIDNLSASSDMPTESLLGKKSDTEKLGSALKQIFVDAGKISPTEELTEEFEAYVVSVIQAAIAFESATKQEPKQLYRAAMSKTNKEHEIVPDTTGIMDKLRNKPKVTKEEDL